MSNRVPLLTVPIVDTITTHVEFDELLNPAHSALSNVDVAGDSTQDITDLLKVTAKRIPVPAPGSTPGGQPVVPIYVANPNMVNLGSAGIFSILAGSTITSTGPTSIVTGNVGLYPGTAITGLISSQVHAGVIEAAGQGFDVLLNLAKNALSAAYAFAAGLTPDVSYGAVDNPLGGLTLTQGVYRFGHAATANLAGILTLDAQNDPNAVWVFQATSDMITAAASSVVLINGAKTSQVFWQVGSSATLGAGASLAGSVMVYASVTATTGASVDGRLMAETAAVTLDSNVVTNAV